MRDGKNRSILLLTVSVSLFALVNCGEKPDSYAGEPRETAASSAARRVNINTASEEELARLPFIGPKIASEIVAYRTQYGPFRRVEYIMLIQGISEKRFREIKNLIEAE